MGRKKGRGGGGVGGSWALSGGPEEVSTEQGRAAKGQKGPSRPYQYYQGEMVLKEKNNNSAFRTVGQTTKNRFYHQEGCFFPLELPQTFIYSELNTAWLFPLNAKLASLLASCTVSFKKFVYVPFKCITTVNVAFIMARVSIHVELCSHE